MERLNEFEAGNTADPLICSSLRRQGFAFWNGTVFSMNVAIDKETITIADEKVLDPFFRFLSVIPFVSLVVSAILALCEAIVSIAHQKRGSNSINKDLIIKTIKISDISHVSVSEKGGLYSKLTKLFCMLPYVNMFAFSLGSVIVVIMYTDGDKIKKETFIFTSQITAKRFVAKLQGYNSTAAYHHNTDKSVLMGFFNVLIALPMLVLMLLGTGGAIYNGIIGNKERNNPQGLALLLGFWIPLIVIIISKLKGEKEEEDDEEICPKWDAVPNKTTSVPKEAASVPNKATSVPMEAASIPMEAASIPNKTTSVPMEAASIPNKTTSVPMEAASVPMEAASIPNKTISVPMEAASIPNKTTSVPMEAASVPNKTTSVPMEAASIPNKTISVPMEAASIPNKTTSVPMEAVSVPNKTTSVPMGEISEYNRLMALFLCLFLGLLGVHRFYVKKIGTGILQLATCGGCGIWTIIDFVMICIGKFKDKSGKVLI
ncbi:hypothetical protein FACS1894200_05550 [Spirochaetia bacterium]|nr:hypothetical protein FACS1894200_05550 [Spirochaetia bacterium]